MMLKLIALFIGTALLMFCSQLYFPADRQLRAGGRVRTDVFLVLAFLGITCFYFLRTSYNDTTAYIGGFLSAETPGEFLASGTLLEWGGNPLFYFYESLVRSITDNFHVFFLLPAALTAWSCVHLMKRYSVTPVFSVVIFFALGTAITLMCAMKQGTAMAILFCALPFALEGKYVRFYLLVFLASLFHAYAVIYALIPLLIGKPWNVVSFILLGLAAFCLVTYRSTLGAFIEYANSLGAHAAEEDVFTDTPINVFRVAVYLVPALLALVFRSRLFDDSTRAENLFVNMSMVSGFILLIGLADGANLMARAAAFYEIGTMIAMPWMVDKIFEKRSARFVSQAASGLYILFFLYEFAIAKDFGSGYASITLWQFILELIG